MLSRPFATFRVVLFVRVRSFPPPPTHTPQNGIYSVPFGSPRPRRESFTRPIIYDIVRRDGRPYAVRLRARFVRTLFFVRARGHEEIIVRETIGPTFRTITVRNVSPIRSAKTRNTSGPALFPYRFPPGEMSFSDLSSAVRTVHVLVTVHLFR